MPDLRALLFPILLVYLLIMSASCSFMPSLRELPPVIGQEELNRPYEKLGRVQSTRQVYGIVDHQTNPEILEWGLNAIREEAAKMGADAVILPEVTGHTTTYLVMPTTEYRATGIAIKFK